MESDTCLPGNGMRCNLRCKFLLLFLLIAAISLSSAFVLRGLIMRDFGHYLDGESQDRVQRVVALLEGSYEKNAGWQRDRLVTDLAWALQLGVEVQLYAGDTPILETTQAVMALPPLMRKRVLDATGYDPRDIKTGTVPYPLYLQGEEIGHIEVRMLSHVKEEYFVRSSNKVLLISVTILSLITIIASIIASRKLSRPILELAEASEEIAHGNLSRRVSNLGHDEIGRLSRSFNSMAHRLEAQEKLRRTLLSNAAHELRTPLAIISGELEGMLDGVLPTDRDALQSMHAEARRLTAILDGVDELSRAEASAFSLDTVNVKLKPFLTALAGRFDRIIGEKNAVLLVDCVDDMQIMCDPDKLSQILINLITNSIKAISPGGRIAVISTSHGDWVTMEITDNGCGISEEELAHVFERFYKGSNGGLGLGLAIVKELATAQGGTITVSSRIGSGTTFCLRLPQTSS